MSDLVRVRIAALALLVGLPAMPALAQEVGKASAVNPAATANLRTITIGSSITHKERIKTAAEGSVQILFVDKTSMTIGPNSDLTIDEYVYDPNAGSGKLAATLGKGALRFVGGQISHSGDAEIKTASAVIGIRGGVALISPQNVYAGYGSSTVNAGGSTVTLGAGEFTQVGGGGPPSPPGPPPPNFVASFIQQFQSRGGQTGGAPKGAASPTNVARAESRATGTNGGAVAGQLTPPVINQLPTLTSSPGNNLVQTVQTTGQNAAVENVVANLPETSLTGYIGGLMESSRHSSSEMSALFGFATVLFSGRRVQADFYGGAFSESDYPRNSFNYQFGSVEPGEPSDSQYVDSGNFGAKAAIGRDGKPISTIDGRALTSHTGEMRTVTAEQARQYAWTRNYDLTACACDYTRWGIWTSESRQNVDGSIYTDRANGFWVAGRAINAADVPTVGTASYAGHVVANVRNGDNAYITAGNLTTTVDFASRSGSAQVANFDGVNYAGSVYIGQGSDARSIAAGLYGTADAGSRSMVLSGEFFRGKTSPVGEMGGWAMVNGPNYVGSGIFAAKMR